MGNIYAVTSGEYSSYGIEFVTTDKEEAELFLEKIKQAEDEGLYLFDCYQIEIFEDGCDLIVNKEYVFSFNLENLEYLEEHFCGFVKISDCSEPPKLNRTDNILKVRVHANNKDTAFKIACDLAAEHKANNPVYPKIDWALD